MFTWMALVMIGILCMHKHNTQGGPLCFHIIAFVGIHIFHQATNHALLVENQKSTGASPNISRYLIFQEIIGIVTYYFDNMFWQFKTVYFYLF